VRPARPIVLLSLLLVALPAAARDYELTPFVGLRLADPFSSDDGLDDGASFGVVFGIPLTDNTAFELLFSRQDTDAEIEDEIQGDRIDVGVDVDHYHFAGVYQGGSAGDRRRGFVTVSAGITRFDPPSDFDGQTELSFALGGGFRWRVGDRTRARFQLRWISTDVGSGDSIACRNSSCVIVTDEYLGQVELSAGVTFRF
jgi:hypothetical protein